ncbi:ribonuclease H-like domain-containing protein [Halostagnicola sp. A-GB9-2]|uniref:ribonuclease H-like domain-containing protein n=1 Tax=Halostagnicola sp. A-GB9-2 TaxID=3048066 RepID=UPI0024C0A745|nr:ribonuclease H-like domain-containing protein [Halostagnicola sp. A-GB9-2]MDJ1433409.1 ribonuclease H-like domain-containing protein [Halostagnicola sp. A-GB9-2]
MRTRDGPRVLVLSPSVLSSRSLTAFRDARAYFEPDFVLVHGPERAPQADARARHAFDVPVVHPPLMDAAEQVQRHSIRQGEPDRYSLLIARSADGLADAEPTLDRQLENTDSVAAVVCDDVTTTVRPTALETDLSYRSQLAAALPAGETMTIMSGGLAAGYDEVWRLEADTGAVLGVGTEGDDAITTPHPSTETAVGVRIVGIGPREGYGTAGSISAVTLGSADRPESGTADTTESGLADVTDVETLSADAFGLEAVSGIGPKTAIRLEKQGVTTRAELLETPIETLSSISGIGRQTALRMHQQARVLESGEPRRLSDEPLPGGTHPGSPLCLDIETDGLSPTIIWQIGVYDPNIDEYHAFVERSSPEDPGPVLERFCDWLFGVHPDRALLTWNGWRFDYRHLESFLNRYVPRYVDAWDGVAKLDLYGWAVGNENAVLPGRTNTLEDVSAALEYGGSDTGLDGAQTAAAYQRFIRTGTELEWDRHEAYCEDDCRALWHVYEQLRTAPKPAVDQTTAANDGTASTNESTTAGSQTGLGDF